MKSLDQAQRISRLQSRRVSKLELMEVYNPCDTFA